MVKASMAVETDHAAEQIQVTCLGPISGHCACSGSQRVENLFASIESK